MKGSAKMFGPSEKKSQESHEIIKRAFGQRVENPAPYKVVYGYFVKTGILTKKVSNYAIGFSEARKEIIVVPISSDGDEVGDAVILKKDDIVSAKFGMQGDLKIKANTLESDLRFTVPPFTSSMTAGAYIMVIDQKEEESAFRNFIKSTF
ncbi:MAG: hypothetical protein LBP73_06765 [Clostridiales Family XIII bacterium]|nr:hypothetical protein [Clostridiales Family XIII bacterium]